MNAARTTTPTVSSTIAKQFHMDRQGKDFILYAGLLDKATDMGLISLQARLVQAPNEQNGHTAICEATAVFPEGRTFTDIGDASPGNVGKMIAMHIIRMASTRAKARALRDGLNIGGAAYEELGPEEDEPVQRSTPARADAPRPLRPAAAQAAPPTASPGIAPSAELLALAAITQWFLGKSINTHVKSPEAANKLIANIKGGIATSPLLPGSGTALCHVSHMAAMQALVPVLPEAQAGYLAGLLESWANEPPTIALAWDEIKAVLQTGEVPA